MQTLSHPVLAELQALLYRHRTILTPHGSQRIHMALIDFDTMHTFIQEMGGLEAIRKTMTKPKKTA